MIKKELLTIVATGAVVLQALVPMAFADTAGMQVSGNGASSSNSVSSSTSNSQSLVQTNTAQVSNNVHSDTNTGGNTADENTGGNVTVDTGNAQSLTDVRTVANANEATMPTCTTCAQSLTTGGAALAGNGASSQNSATVSNTNTSSLFQTNRADVTNDVSSNAQTGNNNADRNTGGDVLVLTGHAANSTTLNTAVNANEASMGSGASTSLSGVSGNGSQGILGNGYGSDNRVDLRDTQSVALVQGNDATVRNSVSSDARSGDNNANENTGGNVIVDTGNALNSTMVDTLANFNSADMSSCGCMTGVGDVLGKIAGNGAFSRNSLDSTMLDSMSVFQGGDNGNQANVSNDVTNNSQSGNSSASRNTGALSSLVDPVRVVTGHNMSDTGVTTSTNMNMFGNGGMMQLPGGTDVSFNFNLQDLLNMMHL